MGKESKEPHSIRSHERWAQFRFSVIGTLLAAPPERGQLREQIEALAAKKWRHPISQQWTVFGYSTIERWYYKALGCTHKEGPVDVLKRKIRCDAGEHPALNSKLTAVLAAQYRQHPNWSYQLHRDNLVVLAENRPELGSVPSYPSVVRFMKSHGYVKRSRRGPAQSPGAQAAEERYQAREIRSYESQHVNALWHLDFHHGSLRVLRPCGTWAYPILLGILDDRSRLCCHLQWYWAEGARELCHGLSQAIQKRALPRSILYDNGSAMIAKETEEGLTRLSVLYENTLPYSPYQNGKQEAWWNSIEGRLLPMLENVTDLTLEKLNEASQAWAEIEYNRKLHSETNQTPLRRYLDDTDVGRPSPNAQQLKEAFTTEVTRTQRRSDGTLSLSGKRFEIPARFGHMQKLNVRYATWDLSHVHLCDPRTGIVLCRLYPQDKARNAEGLRPHRQSPHQAPTEASPPTAQQPTGAMAPLLEKILRQYAATGLPPAYLPGPDPSETP